MRRFGGWSTLLVAFVFSFGTASIGSFLTDLGPWYLALKQPAWKPPDAAFGVIWSTIFFLLTLSGALAYTAAPNWPRKRFVLQLFAINAVVNVAWSALYFGLHRPDWALMEWTLLWTSVVSLLWFLRRESGLAALLILPYLLWVSAAGVLNWTTIALNGPFS
jgi:tryptophan-rich sensory protein